MLKTRLITAAILATLVISGLFYLPPPATAVILGSFLVVGAWEWSGLLGWGAVARSTYTVVLALLAIAVWHWNDSAGIFPLALVIGSLWWLCAGLLVVAAQRKKAGQAIVLAANPISGVLALLPAWSGIVWLIGNDRTMLLVMFVLIWTADGAAYFVGRRWGRRRLASNISPGKSWEGVAGGLVFGGGAAVAVSFALVFSDQARMGFIALGLFTIGASVIGDLLVSLLKRHIGVKDSGHILPGHGGVMDRIDGLVAAAPVFCAGLYFWVNRL